jgi:hypothetical protein
LTEAITAQTAVFTRSQETLAERIDKIEERSRQEINIPSREDEVDDVLA